MAVDVRAIRQMRSFADLSEEACAAIARVGVILHKPQGVLLFLEGDPAPGLFVVQSGRVKIFRTAATGREQVMTVVGPGQQFNTVPVFDHAGCPANAQTLSDCRLLLLPTDQLLALIQRYPDIAMAVLAECCGYLRRLVNLVDDLALLTVQGRLAGLLLELAEAADRGEGYQLTQADMAARLGTVREMIGRTLKTFEGLGYIRIERGTIQVLDREGLGLQLDR